METPGTVNTDPDNKATINYECNICGYCPIKFTNYWLFTIFGGYRCPNCGNEQSEKAPGYENDTP